MMITTRHDLSVDTCATVRGTCPAKYIIDGTLIEFHFGGDRDGVQFAFDSTALQNLLKLGTEALAQLELSPAGHPNTSG
jgi:hypothetical protein